MPTEIVQNVSVNLGNSAATIGQLRQNFDQTTSSINKTEEQFEVFNNTLNLSTGYMKQLKDRAAETAAALEAGMTGIAESTKIAAGTTGELAAGLEKVNEQAAISGAGIGKSLTTAYGFIRQIAYALPGVGIGGIIGLALNPLVDMFNKISDSASNADHIIENLKLKSLGDAISESVGATAGDIANVQALTHAVNDTTLSLDERGRALDMLKETNKAYFGDLTLETATLSTLKTRSDEYTQSLITQAVTKGYLDEITKTTIELNKEKDSLNDLKKAYDAAQQAQSNFKPGAISNTGSGLGVGSGQSDQTQQDLLAEKVNKTKDAFETQREVVEKLSTSVATYTGKIQDAVNAQLKTPLIKDVKGVADNSLKELASYIAESQKILEDAEQKEITSENIKYEKIKKDLIDNHHGTEQLEEQHQQNISDIQKKWADKRLAEQKAAFQKLGDSLKATQQNALDKLSADEEKYIDKSALNNQTGREKEISKEQQKYDDLINEAMLEGASIDDIQDQHRINISTINDKWDAKDLADAQKAAIRFLNQEISGNNAIIRDHTTSYNQKKALLDKETKDNEDAYKKGLIDYQAYVTNKAKISNQEERLDEERVKGLQASLRGAGDIFSALSSMYDDNTAEHKEFAIASITLDNAAALAGVIAAAAKATTWYEAVAEIAAGVAIVVGEFASIHSILNQANVSVPASNSNALTGPSGGLNVPVVPTASAVTNLSAQSINQINQASATPVKAYVVESDLTATVNRVTSYRNAASV